MTAGAQAAAGPAGRDLGLLLVSAAGLAGCVTLVFLGMRAVMNVGGACADGGPYVSAQPCPEGVAPAMLLGIFGLFGFGGLGLYAGARVGGAWVGLPLLAWPGLFLSLGWNFIEYGVAPPGGGGWEWGWLIPGILFVLMGGVPLAIALKARQAFGGPDGGARVTSTFGLGGLGGTSAAAASARNRGEADDEPGAYGSAASGDIVDRLERLARLRRSGDITNSEYEAAKAALLASEGGRS